jgi:deoxyribonuclease-1
MRKFHTLAMTVLACSFFVGSLQSSAFAQATAPKAPAAAPAMATTSTGEIHANKKSKVYHLSTCPGYTKVSEKNLMSFATEDEATKAGYHKAKNCK